MRICFAGEYINETAFLTTSGALNEIKIYRRAITHIAILSDGLQMLALKMPEGTPHKPFFSPLFYFMSDMADEKDAEEQLTAFLRSSRVKEQTDDDLTLLLAVFK